MSRAALGQAGVVGPRVGEVHVVALRGVGDVEPGGGDGFVEKPDAAGVGAGGLGPHVGGGGVGIESGQQGAEEPEVEPLVTQRKFEVIEVGVARPILADVVVRLPTIRRDLGAAVALRQHE